MKIPSTFRRFAVIGANQLAVPHNDHLFNLQENALRIGDLGLPEPIEYGWCGGAHIEDAEFSFRNNVFNDCLVFALRIDTNKVPAAIATAYRLQEEAAIAKDNPSGFISKRQKRDAKDAVKKKLEDELRSGKHRRSKLVPILWDLPNQTLYSPAAGAAYEKLAEIFNRTFNLDLQPLTAGSIALRILEPQGRRREYEDLKPTRFAPGPGGENQFPDYPWVMKGPEPKDFMGNEFLLWLWYFADVPNGGMESHLGVDAVMFDRSIELDCAYGATGKDSLRSVGVSRMPEAMKALQAGKLPRKAGLILDTKGSQYTLALQAETFAITGLKLPEIEKTDSPRTLLEEQITQLRDFSKSIDQLFATFLHERTSPTWSAKAQQIREWIQKGGQK